MNRVEQIVEEIRREIRRAEAAAAGPRRPLAERRGLRRFPTLRDSPELAEVNRGWALEVRHPITSHRPGIGRAIVAAKRRVQGLVASVLEGYFTKEREFQASTVRVLNQIVERLDAISATAHADDERVVARTEVLLVRLQEEQRALEAEVHRLREEVSGMRSGRGLESPPPPPTPEAEFVRGDSLEEASGVAVYVPALIGNAPVLHLPAGDGELLGLLAEEGVTARGLEPDADRVRRMTEKGYDAVAGPLHISGDQAGAVVITETEWMAEHTLRRLLVEAREALVDDGLILVEALSPGTWAVLAHRAANHDRVRIWSPRGLRRLVEECGFTEVDGDAAALAPPPLEIPRAVSASPTLRTIASDLEELNGRLFAPARHFVVGRRPAR